MKQFAIPSDAQLGILAEKGWLAGQPLALRDFVASCGRWITCERDQLIYDFGDPPDSIYGLGEGALEITLPLLGDEPVTLYRAEPGFWIGDAAVLARQPRVLSLRAVVRSRVFRIPGPAVLSLLDREPHHWPSFYALNLQNASLAVTLLAEALSLSPSARLARHLLRMADSDNIVRANQQELARLIGMSRSSLRRALSELEHQGMVEARYAEIAVSDPDRLRDLSTRP